MSLNPLLEPNWLNAILPELILSVSGIILILLDAFAPKLRELSAPFTVIAIIATGLAELNSVGGTFFGGTWQVSGLTRLFALTFLLATLLAAMFARDYLERERIERSEFYALLLWGTVGMMMMAKGLDLLIVILGLETLSVCIFVLVGFHHRIPVSNEASLKYFLMGAFATGFILYGTALFYGAAGSTNLTALADYSNQVTTPSPILTVAFVMLMAGLGFKLALAPFHSWAPDVYQGAPTPVAAWLSVAPKAATILVLIRILLAIAPLYELSSWIRILSILSIASMVLGNFVAIAQRDLKRILAYSGIAHVGYMTIALLTISDDSIAALAVYAVTYALMNIGAFGVVSLLAKNQNDPQTLDDIAGLGFRRPFYGFALAVFMFSLSGLPPTAGFIAKFYVFKVAVDSGHLTIALIGILTSIVSVFYYLRIVYYLYMRESGDAPAIAPRSYATGALAISILGIMVIGIFPAPLFRTALEAAASLLTP